MALLRGRSTKRPDTPGNLPGAAGLVDAAQLDVEIDNWINAERPLFGEVLLALGMVTADELMAALARQRDSGGLLGELLGLKAHQIEQALGAQYGIRVADLAQEIPDRAAVDLVGEEMCRRHGVIPLRTDEEGRTWVVTATPRDTDAIREITLRCGRIGLLLGTRPEIDSALERQFNVLDDTSVYVQAHQLAEAEFAPAEQQEGVRLDENAPVVQVVSRIITHGVRSRASDVHIEAQPEGIRVRYRVDGVLSDAIQLPASMGAAIASRIKVLAELNIVERRRPQDGQFSLTVDGRPVDIRTSVVATVRGEKVVLRILDKQRSLISLHELGMPEELVHEYTKIVKAPLGMLLVTGPTGSGKTTTLYATLNEMNDPTKNVVTVEDPVEYQFAGINQMQISEAAGISFADGLRGILRQDPDTILVGEIRDIETARIAMQAALTGHFVLSSLHAVDSVAAVHRFTDMGVEPFLVASAVSGVMAQRLLRRNCPSCSVDDKPSPDRVRLVSSQLREYSSHFKRGRGCNMCNFTGYRGRVGVYELLTVTDTMRQLIVDKASHSDMRKIAIKEGMRTMQVQAFQLVADGITTVDEVIRAVYAPGVELDEIVFGELMPGRRELEEGAKGSIEKGARGVIESGPIGSTDVDHGADDAAATLDAGTDSDGADAGPPVDVSLHGVDRPADGSDEGASDAPPGAATTAAPGAEMGEQAPAADGTRGLRVLKGAS
ncbi:MAG: ATPase, T2SS/T4P/T4SS family [Microthrixaceae bacterium]